MTGSRHLSFVSMTGVFRSLSSESDDRVWAEPDLLSSMDAMKIITPVIGKRAAEKFFFFTWWLVLKLELCGNFLLQPTVKLWDSSQTEVPVVSPASIEKFPSSA